MKKCAQFLLLMLLPAFAAGQYMAFPPTDNQSSFDGGVGMTWIDNQAFYSINLQPDIALGKFGIGLNVNLLYNTSNGRFYSQDWENRRTGKTDWLRIIRYARYGRKGDPVYGRVGALDVERIGHGFLLNFYNNQIAYEDRKTGLSFDLDLGVAGFESMTNSLERLGVVGGRLYVRPLWNSEIPILKRLAFGASMARDTDPDSRRSTKDGVSVWGADVELPLLKSQALTTMVYADHGQIVDYGSGQTLGLRTDLNTLWGFLGLSFNVERRFMGKEFIAPYFGPFYEMLRHTTLNEVQDYFSLIGGNPAGIPAGLAAAPSDTLISQNNLLSMMTESRNAWYGALDLNFFKLIHTVGSFEKVDKYGNSGTLHLGAGLSPTIPVLSLEAAYDKRGIGTFKDIRTLDARSVARVGVGYKMKPYLMLYMDYIWNFVWNNERQAYQPQERIQPRVAFRFPFDM